MRWLWGNFSFEREVQKHRKNKSFYQKEGVISTMIILDQANTYGFSNTVVKVIDQTYEETATEIYPVPVPDFNVLIPTVQDIGITNSLELYQPGEVSKYLKNHGNPNALKYGFGPDFIHGVLERGDSGVGVYTINLRGASATMANIIVLMKYRIEKSVPYVDADGNQYYKDENNQITTDPVEGGAITRDVLHVRFETANVEECKKWTDLHKGMNAIYNEQEDDEGYKTIPWFGVMYRGASAYGNNIYFSLIPTRAEYDGNMYYKVALFDGKTMHTTDPTYSFDIDSGARYQTTYYFENVFNENFKTMRFMTAEDSQAIVDLFNKYLYTVDEYVLGTYETPGTQFPAVDPFNVDSFAIQVDTGSLNPQITNAFRLQGGYDGTETRDELFRMFFAGEILGDITSPLRYRVNYIPDVNYDDATKRAIASLVQKRIRMTSATVMLGGTDGFVSALIDHQANWYETMPNIRQLAKYQSPMMYNQFTRRTMTYPGTYFDTMAMMEHFAKWGNYFQPFAGAEARWTGYIEDTMPYPAESPQYLQSLQTSRINVVMKDAKEGAYLADQQMNTVLTSDQTEFNNAFLISCMLYDLVDLIHYNHFKFNEAEEVRQFNEAVNDCINSKYAIHSASISASVERVGTIGRSKSMNKITVVVDLKDINKFTDIELYLVDE